MNPVDLGTPVPAPIWFVELFKTLGFVLHSIPMQLWLVGLPLALFLLLIGGPNAKACSRRFFAQLPIITAIGINLGIVPLLFIQTAYGPAFYPTTILTAWHWFGIIPMMLVAYCLIYATAAFSARGDKWRPLLTGSLASLLLIGIGLIFAATWTLMASPDLWPDMAREKSIAAAATGLGTHWRDPVVYIRFAQMIGLGFLTFSCWALFDAYFFYRAKPGASGGKKPEPVKPEGAKSPSYSFAPAKPKPQYKDFHENPNLSRKEKKRLQRLRDRGELSIEDELAALEAGPPDAGAVLGKAAKREKTGRVETPLDNDAYRRWTLRFATCIQWFGVCLAGGFLWFYYYKTLALQSPNLPFLFETNAKFLPMAVLGSLGLFALIALIGAFGKLRARRFAVVLALVDFVTLSLYAVTRQLIQNGQLKGFLDVQALPTRVEWLPLSAFLVLFAFGAVVLFWLLRTAAKSA